MRQDYSTRERNDRNTKGVVNRRHSAEAEIYSTTTNCTSVAPSTIAPLLDFPPSTYSSDDHHQRQDPNQRLTWSQPDPRRRKLRPHSRSKEHRVQTYDRLRRPEQHRQDLLSDDSFIFLGCSGIRLGCLPQTSLRDGLAISFRSFVRHNAILARSNPSHPKAS